MLFKTRSRAAKWLSGRDFSCLRGASPRCCTPTRFPVCQNAPATVMRTASGSTGCSTRSMTPFAHALAKFSSRRGSSVTQGEPIVGLEQRAVGIADLVGLAVGEIVGVELNAPAVSNR